MVAAEVHHSPVVIVLLLVAGLEHLVAGQDEYKLRVQTRKCPSADFTYECPNNYSILILSVTVLSAPTNLLASNAINSTHCPLPPRFCLRTIKDIRDQGLNDLPLYAYFYTWLQYLCQGKSKCNSMMPTPDRLYGLNKDCSLSNATYFVAAVTDYACVDGENAPTVAPPAATTLPPTDPPPTTTTEPPPFLVPVASGFLEPDEKTTLAVTISVAVVILFCLLILLYCCDKWRREKKKMQMLLRLGKPEERSDAVDELKEFAAKEAWMSETEHPEALGEYCGVKPEEVFTIDRKTMDRTDKVRQDGAATLQRGFATMQRGDLQSSSSVTTLTRAAADAQYINNAYIPSNFERMDVLHY